MFIKVENPRPEFGPTIGYHEKKIKDGRASLLEDDSLSDNKNDRIQFMEDIVRQNSRVGTNKAYDISINFHPAESISDDSMSLIARRVSSRLGFDNAPLITYRHNDQHYDHFHMVLPTVDYDGKKIKEWKIQDRAKDIAIALEKELKLFIPNRRDNPIKYTNEQLREERYSVNRVMRKMSKEDLAKYGIDDIQKFNHTNRVIRESIGEVNFQALVNNHFNENKQDLIFKSVMLQQVTDAMNRSESVNEFFDDLKDKGFYIRELNKSNEVVYGIKDNSYYISSKKIGNQFNKQGLKEFFRDKSISPSHTIQDPIKIRLADSIQSSYSWNELEKNLANFNYTLQYDYYKSGKVYGLHFLNYETGESLKASEVGRDFSYGKLSKQLGEISFEPIEISTPEINEFKKPVLNKRIFDTLGKGYDQKKDDDEDKKKKPKL